MPITHSTPTVDPHHRRPVAARRGLRFFWQAYHALLLALALLLSATAGAQDSAGPSPAQLEKNRLANLECLACHSEAGLQKPPKEGMDLKKLRTLLQDPHAFSSSDHQRLACTKCHNEGYDEHPHAADATESTSTCSDCHSKKATHVEKQFERSVHAKNLNEAFVCTTCHNPHVMRMSAKLGDPSKIVQQNNRVCLSCHDSDEAFAKFAPEKKLRPLIDEIHDWLPNTRAHWKAVSCVECHTPAVPANEPVSHEILSKKKAEKNCVACHSANTMLKTRLYRHVAKDEQQKYGFINSVVLSNSYVIGATRHPVLDWMLIGMVGMTLAGVLLHGALRILAAHLRRRKQND